MGRYRESMIYARIFVERRIHSVLLEAGYECTHTFDWRLAVGSAVHEEDWCAHFTD
jgi:Golgi nucleoside diphosphatase